jgi:outer membrane protein OmpA-like peptidoglycan-associated protein
VFLKALCDVNNLQLTPLEMIMTSVAVENKYVGVSSGKLDQSCEVYSRKDKLLYLDTLNDEYELIPFGENAGGGLPFKIAIFFSGVERTLAGSKFNMRVDELRSAAYALKAFAGMEYGKFQETNMREIPAEVYEKYKQMLPHNWQLRAEHWMTEFERVQEAAEAGRMGDSVSVVVSLSPLLPEVGANEVVTIVPHLQAAADTVVLPAIHLLGKMPYYRYIRHDDMSLLMPHDRVLRAHPHQPPFVYREAVSWQQWMQQAELCLVVRRSRLCCDLPADSIPAQRPQMRLQQAPPIIVETSTDSVKGTVRVLFPVNPTEIHPEYMGNSRELSRLEQSIRAVSDDPQTDLQGIIIRGTASPEGNPELNQRLSQARADAVADYLRERGVIIDEAEGKGVQGTTSNRLAIVYVK